MGELPELSDVITHYFRIAKFTDSHIITIIVSMILKPIPFLHLQKHAGRLKVANPRL
jgi:hypothetical protein